MVTRVFSAVPRGVEALRVQVEVDARPSTPALAVVGLPDAAGREARERVLAAIRHLGGELDTLAIVINLSPAEERKEGALLDRGHGLWNPRRLRAHARGSQPALAAR